jgi:hypothetical protein
LVRTATLTVRIIKTYRKMFSRKKWSKWEHVMFVEDFRSGIKNYELMVRTDSVSGLRQYKKIYIAQCIHGFTGMLNSWFSKKTWI